MIRLDAVGFDYGFERVLHDVSLVIEPSEVVGIIGPSGSGKTTLLRLLLGELKPTTGRITSAAGFLDRVGYVPQLDPGERTFPLIVEEMVLLGGAAHSARRPWFDRRERRAARVILDRLSIDHLRLNRLDELSGGQFQRALIARALMADPAILLLDEPTSGIDLQVRRQVLDLVDDLRHDGYTIVLTTHDLNWVASHLPRIVCLNTTIIADGAPLDILTPDVVLNTYGAEMDVIVHNGRPVVIDGRRESGRS